jgi:hypothetical protein
VIDGDWSGVLRKTNATTGQVNDLHDFGDEYMFGDAASCVSTDVSVFALRAKGRTEGGDRLLLYSEDRTLSEPSDLRPPNEFCSIEGGWRRIESLALHPKGHTLAVALVGRTPEEPGVIVLVDLDGNELARAPLPSRMHFVHSMAWSISGLLCAAVHENTYGKRATEPQWPTEGPDQVNDYVYLYRDSNLSLIDRWPWRRASTLQFSTDGLRLAISGEPFACLSDVTPSTVA